MDTRRQLRIASVIKDAFSEILVRDGKNIYGTAFVTVTNVKVTSDLTLVRFYLSIFNVVDKEEVNKPTLDPCRGVGDWHLTLDQQPLRWVFWVDLIAGQEVVVLLEQRLQLPIFIPTLQPLQRACMGPITQHVDLAHWFVTFILSISAPRRGATVRRFAGDYSSFGDPAQAPPLWQYPLVFFALNFVSCDHGVKRQPTKLRMNLRWGEVVPWIPIEQFQCCRPRLDRPGIMFNAWLI